MLKKGQDQSPLRVLGIDPGSYATGIALLSYPLTGMKTRITHVETLKSKMNPPHYRGLSEIHSDRVARLSHLRDQFHCVLREHRFDVVCIESPFVGKSVKSYGALVECINYFHQCIMKYDPTIPYHSYSPHEVKRTVRVRGDGTTTKVDMRDHVNARTDLVWDSDIPDGDVDEHGIDAIAVALTHVQSFYPVF